MNVLRKLSLDAAKDFPGHPHFFTLTCKLHHVSHSDVNSCSILKSPHCHSDFILMAVDVLILMSSTLSSSDGYFDFIYLDARHDYGGVVEDLHAWWPKVNEPSDDDDSDDASDDASDDDDDDADDMMMKIQIQNLRISESRIFFSHLYHFLRFDVMLKMMLMMMMFMIISIMMMPMP